MELRCEKKIISRSVDYKTLKLLFEIEYLKTLTDANIDLITIFILANIYQSDI